MAGGARVLSVRIVGDARDLERTLKGSSDATEKSSKKFLSLGKAAALGAGAAGVGLLVAGLKSSVGAAREAEKAQARLESALDGANLSYDRHGKAIDAAIQKTSRLAAIDDEELSDVFANLVRTTGDVTKATEGMNLAADIARSRNVSLAAAAKSVEKAYVGSDAALKRFGIAVPKVNDAQEAAKKTIEQWAAANDGKLTPALKDQAKNLLANAKTLDKNAAAQNAIALAQEKFAGGAEKYGKTSAAAQERFAVALENVQEQIGAKLLPILARFFEELVKGVDWLTANWPKISKTIEESVNRARPAIELVVSLMKNMVQTIRGLVDIVIGIFTGDWGRAWDGMKRVVNAALDNVKAILRFEGDVWKAILRKIGELAVDGLEAALKGLVGLVRGALMLAVNAIRGLGDEFVSAARGIGGRVVQAIVDGLAGTRDRVVGLLNAVPGAIRGLGEAYFNAAMSIGGRIVSGILNALQGLGSKILAPVRSAINFVVDRVNGIIGRINSALEFATPELKVLGKTIVPSIKFDAPDIPNVPRLAAGGIVDAPTLAMIGEAGPEAVVPLGRGGVLGDLYATIVLEVDGDELARVNRKFGLRTAQSLVPSSVTGDGAYGLG